MRSEDTHLVRGRRPFSPSLIWIALFLVAASLRLAAQHEYDTWYFGPGFGVDFSGGAPAALEQLNGTNFTAFVACVSDRHTGSLLFYSDGRKIWNREHTIMKGGDSIDPGIGGSTIPYAVPDPHDSARYYLICQQVNGIVYYLIDMRLDGGRGGVASRDNYLVRDAKVRGVGTVAHCSGDDNWIVVVDAVDSSHRYRSFQLTRGGISAAPVVSVIHPWLRNRDAGSFGMNLIFSPNGRYAYFSGGHQNTLLRFDPATGLFTNLMSFIVIRDVESYVDYRVACFSPDNSKLYLHAPDGITITRPLYQFDLSKDDSLSIFDSRVAIRPAYPDKGGDFDSTTNVSSMRVGPDGKIYVAYERPGKWVETRWLGAIERPDLKGDSAGFVERKVQLKFSVKETSQFLHLPTPLPSHASETPCTILSGPEAFYPPHICSGHERRVGIEYVHRYQTDTAIGIEFTGEYADHFTLDTTLPYVLTPGRTDFIPSRLQWDQPGRYTTQMVLHGRSGRTYQQRIITIVDSTEMRVLDVDTIHVGTHAGAFDTCIVLRNVANGMLRFSDTIWRAEHGSFSLALPGLPLVASRDGSMTLCLHMENVGAAGRARVVLGGELVDSTRIPRCAAHAIVIDAQPPRPPVSGVEEMKVEDIALTAHPNPFSERVTIEVTARKRGPVRLSVVDLNGDEVRPVYAEMLEAGRRTFSFSGTGLAAGTYWLRLDCGGRVITRVITLQR